MIEPGQVYARLDGEGRYYIRVESVALRDAYVVYGSSAVKFGDNGVRIPFNMFHRYRLVVQPAIISN
jgi:hypothetical protein